MKAILKQITSDHNRLRTPEVVGELLHFPEVGTNLMMFAEPLEAKEGYTRLVQTSTIITLSVLGRDNYLITTRNSVYNLEITRNAASD